MCVCFCLKKEHKVPLKENVDEALISCPDVKNVIVSRRSNDSVMVRGRDLNLDDAMTRQRPWCPPEGETKTKEGDSFVHLF